MAAAWAECIRARLPRSCDSVAIALANHPQAIALFFAVSSLPLPVILLSPDPRTWRSSPPIPAGTPLFLAPAFGQLTRAGEALGLRTYALPEPRISPPLRRPAFLSAPGFVTCTSGSTGPPKPVYIATRSFLLQAASIVEAYRLPEGCGLVASLPLSSHFGLGHGLILPTVLQSPIGLVEQFDHRSVLNLFMSGQYHYWAGTPLMADMLARALLPEPRPPAPQVCHISAGRLSEAVFRAFLKRFEVALRPSYGRTENGFITAETSPPVEVRPETVGRAAPGIQIRVGDDPHDPYPPGKMGRVWFTSAWYMEGYGFPPRLETREGRDGWWPTEDVGVLDQAGCLMLVGRLDDCFKTSSGHLVNPAEVTRVLTSQPGVRDAAVVPVPGGSGPVIGALVEADEAIEAVELRASAVRELPSWLQPRILLVTAEIPRLPSGKVDRQTCVTILAKASGTAGV